MTTPAPGPTVLVVHADTMAPAAQRIMAFCNGAETVRVLRVGVDDTFETLRELAGLVTGHSVVRVLHLVDGELEGHADIARTAITDLGAAVAAHPALSAVQWLVLRTGVVWDTHEETLPRYGLEVGSQVSGSVLVSRSSEASGLMTDAEEIAMAADIGYTLVTTDLIDANTGAIWAAGATSACYSRALLAEAIGAHYALTLVDESLLRPLAANQPYGDSGRQWAIERRLDQRDRAEALLVGPIGGSVLTRLRPASRFFEDVQLELLPDALASYAEQVSSQDLIEAYGQMGRNAQEASVQLHEIAKAQVLEVLRGCLCVAEARDFVTGATRSLDETVLTLQLTASQIRAELPTLDDVREQLERRIRKLPYGAAIALRAIAFAAAGASLGQVASDPNRPWLSVVSATAAGLLSGLPLWLKQRLGVRKIRLLRERFLDRLGRRLEEQCRAKGVELCGEIVARLVEVLGEEARRLAAFESDLALLRMSLERAVTVRDGLPLSSTRFSCALPSPVDVPTADLVRRFPVPPDLDLRRALGALLVSDDLKVDLERVLPELRDLVLPLVADRLWPDMAELLEDLPLSLNRVAKVLATETAPIMRRQELAGRDYDLARLLCAPALLIERLSSRGALEDLPFAVRPPGRDPNFISLVSFVDVRSVLTESSVASE